MLVSHRIVHMQWENAMASLWVPGQLRITKVWLLTSGQLPLLATILFSTDCSFSGKYPELQVSKDGGFKENLRSSSQG